MTDRCEEDPEERESSSDEPDKDGVPYSDQVAEVAAPTMPPSDPTVNRIPRLNGVKPRAFFRYRMRRAAKTALEKKFDHAVHAAMNRSRGSPNTTWRPSRMSARTDRRSAVGGTVSRFRIPINVRAEKKNEAASNSMAMGAVNHSMTAPATAGPLVPAMEFVVSNLLFASTSWLRSTRAGREAWDATSQQTARVPMMKE